MKAVKFNILVLATAVIASVSLNSCSDEYEDREIITDTYSGNIDVTSVGFDPAGDFTGNGDSGTFSFAWRNPQRRASANFDITTNTGSVQMIINDNAGTVVLDRILTAGGVDSYSGVSDAGEEGIWIVKLIITDFIGDGSYSLHPGN